MVAARIPSRGHAGWPLHVLSGADGSVLRSFGADQAALTPGEARASARRLAKAESGRIWAAHQGQYLIELWDLEGRKHVEVRGSLERFERSDLPRPSITGVWEDAGLLWVMIHVADPRYAENVQKLEDPGDGLGPRIGPADGHALYDTVLEVIDPASGQLVATRRFDDSLNTLGDDAPIIAYRLSADGSPLVDVLRASLAPDRLPRSRPSAMRYIRGSVTPR